MSRRIKRTVARGDRANSARPHRDSRKADRPIGQRPSDKPARFAQKRGEPVPDKPWQSRPRRIAEEPKAKVEAEQPLPTKVQTVVVTPDEDNMRVDRFLEARFPGLSFSHIQRIVRKGELRVNGKRADSKD